MSSQVSSTTDEEDVGAFAALEEGVRQEPFFKAVGEAMGFSRREEPYDPVANQKAICRADGFCHIGGTKCSEK